MGKTSAKIGNHQKWPRAIAFVLFAFVFAVVWMATSNSEPRHGGKLLSEWATQYGTNYWGAGRNSPGKAEAEQAIQAIGTDAIPYLLEMIETPEPVWRRELRKHTPQKWHQRLRLEDNSQEQRRKGSYGLTALGDSVAPAVPVLIRIGLEHPDEDSRYVAVFTLRTLGPSAEPAIPFLIQCLTNSSWMIRDDAALGLGYLQLRSDLAVPALTAHLRRMHQTESPQSIYKKFEFWDTIESVGRFGPGASNAIDEVSLYLDHAEAVVRSAATNALRRISLPEPPLIGPVIP